MSFDLYFCWQQDAPLDLDRFCDFFAGIPNFETIQLKSGEIQVFCENKVTGVYFSFESQEETDDLELKLVLPSGFSDTRIAFNLNFNRPCFFAHEAMPWVQAFAKALDLWIVDPQEDWDAVPSVPKHYTADEMIASWERHNTWAVHALHDQNEPDDEVPYIYCTREKSLYRWNYVRQVDKLQERLGDSIFVPSLEFFWKGKGSTVDTAFVWSDALPQVFPQADLVIHNQIGRNWRGQRVSKKLQVLPYGEVIALIEHLLKPCESSIPGLRYLRAEDSKEIRSIFQRCRGTSFEEFHGVAPDSFVDVVLDSSSRAIVQ